MSQLLPFELQGSILVKREIARDTLGCLYRYMLVACLFFKFRFIAVILHRMDHKVFFSKMEINNVP